MQLTVRVRQGWVYGMRRVLVTVCLAVLTVFLGYKVVFGANGMKVWQAKRAEAEQLQQEIDRMKQEHEALERRVDRLQHGDPDVIEKEAREQLGYVKPGEVVLYQPRTKTDLKRPAVAVNTDQR